MMEQYFNKILIRTLDTHEEVSLDFTTDTGHEQTL